MCAIFGFNGRISAEMLRLMFVAAENWGHDAAGGAYVIDGEQRLFKKAAPPNTRTTGSRFLLKTRSKTIREMGNNAYIGLGHTRAGTHGSNIDQNAHPFEHDGIMFAHNGIIRNYREIMPKAVVDSECLGPLVRDLSLGRAQGSNGLIWLDKGQLYCYRRNQRLSSVTGSSYVDGSPLTLIGTDLSIVKFALDDNEPIVNTPIEEGIAYRVDSDGISPVWTDVNRYPLGHHVARHTGYVGKFSPNIDDDDDE